MPTPAKAMNPYLAGSLAGLLVVGSVFMSGKYFGASTTFVRGAGYIERFFSAERVKQLEYFVKEAPKIDWQFLFVIGIFLGSLIAALASGTFKVVPVADTWRSRFGDSIGKRGVVGFLGGAIAMFGARLADG